MSYPVLKRNNQAALFGLAAAGILISALTVHPQTVSEDAASRSQAGSGVGLMNKSAQAGTASGAAGTSSAATTGSGKAAAGSGTVSASDRNLMRELANANLSEIATAKLAQSNSKNEKVRTFAQKMVDDHTKALDDLTQLAQSKGVSLPAQPDSKHQAVAKKLGALSGDAFDRQYIAQAGVKDHRDTQRLLQRVSTRAGDTDLKAYAGKIRPTVDQHLTMAEQMRGGKQARAGSGG
ncbi:MAG: hypothetical protein JWQ21_4080 [Herminiimonas sp.]|nr:hypothetical protein [Herminiimonas sp.]